MASAERDYNSRGSGGGAPSGGPGDRALGGSSGGGQSPLKLNAFFVFACPKKAANLSHYWYLQKSVNHTVNERVIV